MDELGENDQFAMLKALVRNADVEGVQRHLEVLDYNGATVSARSLGLAARLPLTVLRRRPCTAFARGDATGRRGLQRADARAVRREHNALDLRVRPGRGSVPAGSWVETRGKWYDDIRGYGPAPIRMDDTEALAVLELSECSARLVNATARSKVNHAFTRTPR